MTDEVFSVDFDSGSTLHRMKTGRLQTNAGLETNLALETVFDRVLRTKDPVTDEAIIAATEAMYFTIF